MIWAPRWLTALVVALASSVLMLVTTPARAADGETELGATQLAAQTYPGVQLIQADFTSTISVPQAIIDEAAVNELYTRLVVQAATGAIGTAESQIIDAFVAELAKDPFHYVTPTDARTTVEVGLSGFGTGFVVNAEGYLVTAAHVIAPDPDELKVEFARAGLRDLIANDLDEVQASGVAYSPAKSRHLGPGLPGLVHPLPRGGRGEHDGERPDRRRDGRPRQDPAGTAGGDHQGRRSLPGQGCRRPQAGRCGPPADPPARRRCRRPGGLDPARDRLPRGLHLLLGHVSRLPGPADHHSSPLRASRRSTRISNRPPPARWVSPFGLPSHSSRPATRHSLR
jgi:hypothetical protein